MKRPHTLVLLAMLPCALAAAQSSPPAEMATMPASTHVVIKASAVPWGDPPPGLGKGAQTAVMSGDPGQPGMYVIRIKASPGFKVAKHWHPTDEQVTLIEGDLTFDMGEGASQHMATLAPGDYVLLPARMHHAASTVGGAVVQINGQGPFEINYVDPKDDPRNAMPADDATK